MAASLTGTNRMEVEPKQEKRANPEDEHEPKGPRGRPRMQRSNDAPVGSLQTPEPKPIEVDRKEAGKRTASK